MTKKYSILFFTAKMAVAMDIIPTSPSDVGMREMSDNRTTVSREFQENLTTMAAW